MKVKKFFKGLMAAALAVTMAVTPVSAVKAAEVTVTSGASTYTFSQEPVAAFLVTGWKDYPIILYVLPKDTQVHSQSDWEIGVYGTEMVSNMDYNPIWKWTDGTESERNGKVCGEAWRDSEGLPYLGLGEIYHNDVSGVDAIFVMESIGLEDVYFNNGQIKGVNTQYTENGFDITVIPEIFAGIGGSAVQIPVADALAMDNANVQLDTANTQTADAQAQADALAAQQAAEAQAVAQAQADAQAAQQAAEAAQAQAQADALAAQQAADAAAQAQITAQPDSTVVSQGTYIVEANDNLCKIAEKVYGDRKAWKEIYKANPTIKSDYVIYRGQVLVIPAR